MKENFSDLAIFGGLPGFSDALHVGRPNIGNRDRLLERISDMLDRRWLTNAGTYVKEFEKNLSQLLGVRNCIAMCNGTVALEIAIRALGLSGEVIVPSFTFVATAHSLQWQEITPVFCDIDPDTYNIDCAKIEKLITPRTTGIIGVHLWGRHCAIADLEKIAERHGLHLIFDAAHALGCSSHGSMIGSFGDAEVFSFHATKFINSFEGGAVATNDDELANRIRLMKNFGFAGYDKVIHIGTNGKMPESSAAMGLTSLESINDFIAHNLNNYRAYDHHLSGIPGVQLMRFDEGEKNNYQYIVVEIDKAITGVDRDTIMEILHAENIIARRYFYPGCHAMEPYRTTQPNAGIVLTNTKMVAEKVIVLPTGTSVTADDIMLICQIIRVVIKYSKEISYQLNLCSTDG